MAVDIKEEIANYLLNNCFLMGTVDTTREKYYYVINHEESFRQIFLPIGYTLVVHRNLRVIQLINNHGSGRVILKKYESIILLILRLLYVEKRESLSTSEDMVFATVEEIKNEYEKLNLPRKFDRVLLEESLRNIKRYNLLKVEDRLSDMDAKIRIYPSVMLAMPDVNINKAYEETAKLLAQYENSEDGDEE
ncbi:MAG: DUF4194 domain-containing protein [Lachnospiraceae bacterium]|jgi:hypothetical protein|uniref:DUF4194 domain-containing protein n=1 Tax=Lachnoanaerobaculum orale TaxID=979627 RepID=UPI000247024D|nr:DUF4194 domain-containing protein [Lachnoanaerobaculum orale]EHO48805.1 hypothetical protein HMPREF9099_03051 [Lachnospiraceae bacterium oral taxon 082 str. F0431]MBF1010302.1 DUF4194 domain-containing protein [Lachnoanaerobaculum sp.]MDU5597121.1 DUF4194 domain-containing protein [Lachnospiraceae bacterium]